VIVLPLVLALNELRCRLLFETYLGGTPQIDLSWVRRIGNALVPYSIGGTFFFKCISTRLIAVQVIRFFRQIEP
jgi:hypothetical protein